MALLFYESIIVFSIIMLYFYYLIDTAISAGQILKFVWSTQKHIFVLRKRGYKGNIWLHTGAKGSVNLGWPWLPHFF